MATLTLLAFALEGSGLINLLIGLLIFAIVVWLVYFILGYIPLPEPIKTIALVVIGIILLLVLLRMLGVF
jgi:hypothetical protein